ncbi:MAG: dnaJ domain protein [Candidatus Xenolissoclinum pacificiensis L6]|uniref:DnaJ domain protein n=1 Tax=Candidatus Xenolissoclinum pacificiensis L6 TaxID=1401685 RepID=W2V351_9RICK|nr:MAG: dnaJ domain protein [Candidatus Xenolissoclinum pacificiensis L6]
MKVVDAVVEKAFFKQDYFTLFGLDLRFHINLERLDNAYTKLQKRYHPDRFSLKQEKIFFQKVILFINEGYNVLLNDIKRAQCILDILDVDYSDEVLSKYTGVFAEILTFKELNAEARDLNMLRVMYRKNADLFDENCKGEEKNHELLASIFVKLRFLYKLIYDTDTDH